MAKELIVHNVPSDKIDEKVREAAKANLPPYPKAGYNGPCKMFVDVNYGIPPQAPIYGLPICKGKCPKKTDECRRIPYDYDGHTRTVTIRCECSVPRPHINVRNSVKKSAR